MTDQLIESLLFRYGYLRECRKTSYDYFQQRIIELQIKNIEAVLVDLNVLPTTTSLITKISLTQLYEQTMVAQ